MSRRKLALHPEAAAEVHEARTWYRAQRPSLEREFLGCLALTFDALKDGNAPLTPFPFVPEASDIKRVYVTRFPYSLFVLPTERPILVLAVAHHHRRPGYWLPRLVK